MFQAPASTENAQKFQQITQILRSSPTQSANYAKFAHYTLRFRCLTSGKELLKIPANQAKFAQFAQLHCELCEFCVFCTKLIHIQFTNFRSLTIDREPRKIGANQPDFAQFAHNSRGSHEIR